MRRLLPLAATVFLLLGPALPPPAAAAVLDGTLTVIQTRLHAGPSSDPMRYRQVNETQMGEVLLVSGFMAQVDANGNTATLSAVASGSSTMVQASGWPAVDAIVDYFEFFTVFAPGSEPVTLHAELSLKGSILLTGDKARAYGTFSAGLYDVTGLGTVFNATPYGGAFINTSAPRTASGCLFLGVYIGVESTMYSSCPGMPLVTLQASTGQPMAVQASLPMAMTVTPGHRYALMLTTVSALHPTWGAVNGNVSFWNGAQFRFTDDAGAALVGTGPVTTMIPEPSSAWMLALGTLVLLPVLRRRGQRPQRPD